MANVRDAAFKRGLQPADNLIFLLALWLFSGCAGPPAPAGGISPSPGPWPPVQPRQAQRLGSSLPPDADPLAWWKATVFDSLPPAVYAGDFEAHVARALIEETNQTRADNGLSPVIEDDLLSRVATAHARDQAVRDYWSHASPEGMGSRDRVRAAAGIGVLAGGENSSVTMLLTNSSAGRTVYDWEHHPGHRELLLSPEVDRVGIGIWRYGPGEFVHIVQLLMAY